MTAMTRQDLHAGMEADRRRERMECARGHIDDDGKQLVVPQYVSGKLVVGIDPAFPETGVVVAQLRGKNVKIISHHQPGEVTDD